MVIAAGARRLVRRKLDEPSRSLLQSPLSASPRRALRAGRRHAARQSAAVLQGVGSAVQLDRLLRRRQRRLRLRPLELERSGGRRRLRNASTPHGALLGGQLGYNWQTGPRRARHRNRRRLDEYQRQRRGLGGVCVADGGGLCQTKQDWFGTTRGRIGYAFGRFCPMSPAAPLTATSCLANDRRPRRKPSSAGRAGGGVEYSLTRNWSAKVEYLHLDLGTASFVQRGIRRIHAVGPRRPDDLVRAGINYHW